MMMQQLVVNDQLFADSKRIAIRLALRIAVSDVEGDNDDGNKCGNQTVQ
jgi:hypothetical protein